MSDPLRQDNFLRECHDVASEGHRWTTAWRLADFLSGDLPVWYMTLALFAGMRLGKTAYDTRP